MLSTLTVRNCSFDDMQLLCVSIDIVDSAAFVQSLNVKLNQAKEGELAGLEAGGVLG